MRKRITAMPAVLALLCFCGLPTDAQEDNQPPEGFTALFNGKDIRGSTGPCSILPMLTL